MYAFTHLDEVEKMAVAYGVTEITSEVSLTARPFLNERGIKWLNLRSAEPIN